MGGEKTLGGRWGELGWKESYVFFHFQMREQGLSMFRAGDRGRMGSWKSYEREGLVGENRLLQRWGERSPGAQGGAGLRLERAAEFGGKEATRRPWVPSGTFPGSRHEGSACGRAFVLSPSSSLSTCQINR